MSWLNKELASVCEVFADGDWIESKDQSEDGVRLIQTGNVGFGYFKSRDSKSRYVSEETFRRLRCTEIKQGDILISRLPDPVGRACLIPELEKKSITAVDCTIIRTRAEILTSHFLNYYCQSPQYFDQVKKNITGSTRQRISRSLLGKTIVPLPPLQTQQKIVTKLDAIFAEIDKATAAAEANAKNTEALFKAYLGEVFSELVSENPATNLKSLCIFENGDRGKNYPSKQHQIESGIPFINAGDLKDGWKISKDGMAFISMERFNLLGAGKVKKGDLLFCLRGSLGKCGIVEDIEVGAIASSLVIIRPIQDKSVSRFIYWFLSSPICHRLIEETKGGTAQPNLSAKTVMNYEIPLVNYKKQSVISKNIDEYYFQAIKLKTSYLDKAKALSVLKNSILQQAFNGELVKG